MLRVLEVCLGIHLATITSYTQINELTDRWCFKFNQYNHGKSNEASKTTSVVSSNIQYVTQNVEKNGNMKVIWFICTN